MQNPDNLVALHKQMTGSYVVDAPPLATKPLDWWALNLIEGLQADRERLVEALRAVVSSGTAYKLEDFDQCVIDARELLEELDGKDAGIRGEEGDE